MNREVSLQLLGSGSGLESVILLPFDSE